MNSKLLIITIFGLTAIGSLFLFSKNPPQLEPQTANIIETVTTPTPSKTSISKIKSTPHLGTPFLSASPDPTYRSTPSLSPSAAPLLTKTPIPTPTSTSHLETWFPSSSPTPIPTPNPPIPTPSPTPSPSSSDSSGSSAISSPSTTPAPFGSSQHTFYTSSHWKAKYYYCDTDNGWKDLSPTYLKPFSSEAELLVSYSRILHEPCKE